MEVHPDFRDLLGLFNEHEDEYLIVGGCALAFHAAPRYNGNIDLLVNPTTGNVHRILSALNTFGFSLRDLRAEDFEQPEKIIQLGVPPVRVDLITLISGVTWQNAEANKAPGFFGDVPISYLGRAEFIENKKASSRIKDLADLEALGEE